MSQWCNHLIWQPEFTHLFFAAIFLVTAIIHNLIFSFTAIVWDMIVLIVLTEAETALVISFRHHFPVPHSVDRAGSQQTEQQNQSTMWVLKTTFSLIAVGWFQASAVFFQLLWAIMVWGCFCLYGQMLACETNTSHCSSVSGFEDLPLCGSLHCSLSVIISTWHKHRIAYSSGCLILLSYTYARLSCTDQLPLISGKTCCFLHKRNLFRGQQRDENPVCICAFVCESYYHN